MRKQPGFKFNRLQRRAVSQMGWGIGVVQMASEVSVTAQAYTSSSIHMATGCSPWEQARRNQAATEVFLAATAGTAVANNHQGPWDGAHRLHFYPQWKHKMIHEKRVGMEKQGLGIRR